ncbi:hypothetical protein AB395_00004543 (plasmid) [Sinorhizobium fredii CCBAU 45436]|nr:hypothetical protein AB395_00004543 [Sinorhizobium fredii CCBAU 45436]CCE98771.1 hypothetical protein SFHH103_04291 [Sinorhizobium fredii HH103]CEO91560.1 hypothetical protein SFHH103_psfHH103d_359 [Sinorhizobium fredii HH103]
MQWYFPLSMAYREASALLSGSRGSSAVSYLRSDDATPMGSRNGHAVLAIWNRPMRLDIAGFRNNPRACIERAEGFAAALRSVGVLVLLNPWSLTVVFPKQSGMARQRIPTRMQWRFCPRDRHAKRQSRSHL